MEKMENMENPKKLAVATIAGLTEVAGMAAPAMADETAADPMVGQTQSADPTKDALDKALIGVTHVFNFISFSVPSTSPAFAEIEVNQTYALADAAQAHRDLEARKTTGSTVLVP